MAVQNVITTERLASFPPGLTDQARKMVVLGGAHDFTTGGGQYPKWILCIADGTLTATAVDDSASIGVPMVKGQYLYALLKSCNAPAASFVAGY